MPFWVCPNGIAGRVIPDLAHIVVVQRPGWTQRFEGELGQLYADRQLHDPAALGAAPAGGILLRQVTQLEIASSSIRSLIAAGGDPRFLVPDGVRELMLGNHTLSAPEGGAIPCIARSS